MGFLFENFDILFTVMLIFSLLIFVVAILMMFSPKVRSKFMKRQIRATKYMVEESQDDLIDLATLGANIAVKSQKKTMHANKDDLTELASLKSDIALKSKKNIMDENEEILENLATKSASINQKGVEITARAIKKGLTESEKIHCKHCGKSIDDDSEFCKHCGKSVK